MQRPCALLQIPRLQPPSALQQPFPRASSSGLLCPRKDLASTFHNEATFCFAPLLVATLHSSCTGCSPATVMFWGRVKQLPPAKPQREYFSATALLI